MHIFYFVKDVFPAWRFDVVEIFGNELPKLGFEVAWSMRRKDVGWCQIKSQNGQQVYLPPFLGKNSILAKIGSRLLEVLWEIRLFFMLLIGQRYDVIQVRDDRYVAAFFAWIAARLRGAKFAYWLSFPFPENDSEKSLRSSGFKRAYLATRGAMTEWWLYHFLLRRADHIFVQSDEMLRVLASKGIPVERMTPVPMAVPERLVSGILQFQIKAIPGRIVYVGTLSSGRHLETILDAFEIVLRRYPSAELFMVGEGDEPSDRQSLERRAVELGIVNSTHFTGFVTIEKAWEILGSAYIGLSPFYPDRVLKMSSPTKLVECMAMSKPIVCNEHPEHTAVIRDSNAGLCVEWSAESFAAAICELLEHPEKAVALGSNGPDWVKRHRTYPIITEQVASTYRHLLAVKS